MVEANVPRVSVLMTVFNGAEYLPAAISSILEQSMDDFEFIIVDDGSTDNSLTVINEFDDRRIRVFPRVHEGLVAALNYGLSVSRAPLIARMDADDVSRADRLHRQVREFELDPLLGMVCSDADVIDDAGKVVGQQIDEWGEVSTLREGLTLSRPMKPIVHPTVVLRKSFLQQLGGYRDYPKAEDRDLWLRMVDRFPMKRLNAPLLQYRIHPGGVSRGTDSEQDVSSMLAVFNYLVAERTGVDLYATDRKKLHEFREELRLSFEGGVQAGAQAYRSARNNLRRREYVSGGFRLLRAVARHGKLATPDGVRSRMYKVLVKAVEIQARTVSAGS